MARCAARGPRGGAGGGNSGTRRRAQSAQAACAGVTPPRPAAKVAVHASSSLFHPCHALPRCCRPRVRDVREAGPAAPELQQVRQPRVRRLRERQVRRLRCRPAAGFQRWVPRCHSGRGSAALRHQLSGLPCRRPSPASLAAVRKCVAPTAPAPHPAPNLRPRLRLVRPRPAPPRHAHVRALHRDVVLQLH